MIIGDIETTEKTEYEDLLKNYYEKMEIIEEQDKEIERLNNIISELEKFICDLEIECNIDNSMWGVAVIIHNKLKELKGSNGAIPPEVIGTNGENGGLFDYGDR